MIENHLLHATAWGLLRVLPPRKAFRWTARVARLLPMVIAEEDALRIAKALDSRGTCLSRSLTLAARLRDAEVVIGVDGRSVRGQAVAFSAHAWVEVSGTPLRPTDVIEGEIVRIRAREED
jgi:Transglutaminase-like superfamily